MKTIMATGDNGLTAIAVGKECGIINPEVPVFIGDVVTNNKGHQYVQWSNVDRAWKSVKEEDPPDLMEVMKSFNKTHEESEESSVPDGRWASY